MFPNFQTVHWIGFIIVTIVLLAMALRAFKKKEYTDIDLKIPDTRRTDLLYGYYSSIYRTYDQVKSHVNLFWFSNFFSVEQLVEIMRTSHCKFVVDLSPHLFESGGKRSSTYKESAEIELRNFLMIFRRAGVLDKITYLYPCDEPNLFVKSAEDHLKAIKTVKKVQAEFHELSNSKLAVIYAGGGNWMNVGEFDVAGVDHYDQKSELLTVGEHADLLKNLRPDQKTFLVPGPSFGHNPTPWVAYALLHPEQVEAVIPFIWFDDVNHKDTSYTGLEALPEEFRQQWIDAAHICTNTDRR